jgi:hypothetical protein
MPRTIARLTRSRGVRESSSRSLQRSAIASENPQPGHGEQVEQRPPLWRHLVQQPRKLPACEEASLLELPRATATPPRQHDAIGRVLLEHARSDRRIQRRAQRRQRVGDRTVAQPAVAPRLAREPVHEPLHGGAVEIAQTRVAVEVAQRERREQPAVLAARVLPDAVATRTGVTIQPAERERMQRRPAPLRPRLGVAGELDGPRLGERRSRLLALPAVGAVDHDVLRPTPVDARHVGRLEWQHHQCCPVATGVATSERSPGTENPLPTGIQKARPRGFEPLTFGSVGRGSDA